MNIQKQIKAAERRCRAAFAKQPEATFSWCCHHERLFEQLTEPAENRIRFILGNKTESEQVTRLNNFRPVRFFDKFKPARDAYDTACKPARDAYDTACKPASDAYYAACKPARDAYDTACKSASDAYDAACKSARDAYDAACKSASRRLMKLYNQDVPLGTWNGKSIFKQ
jgi:hypothetical protein